MAAVDLFKGYDCTLATDSLGGTTLGKITGFDVTIANNLGAHYVAGARTPDAIKEGNQLISGNVTMRFRDKTEVLDLVIASPIADDTYYVQASDGVSGTQTVDLTFNNLKQGDWGMSFDDTGSEVLETHTYMCKTLTVAESTN